MPGYISQTRSVLVTLGTYTAADFSLDLVNPPKLYRSVADAYVNPSSPTANYGAATTLRLDADGSAYTSYLRFNVSGLTKRVQSAKLRLFVTNTSPQAGALYTVADTYQGATTPWTETGLKWNNAPAITGAPLSTGGSAATSNAWVEFDVTAAVRNNGIYSFGLKGTSTNDVQFSSKEGANPPQLVVQQSDVLFPAIDSFSPAEGLVGAKVTINGVGFVDVTEVAFNGVPAGNFIVDADTRIRAVVPDGATSGRISIKAGEFLVASTSSFTVIPPPTPIPIPIPTPTPMPTPPMIDGFAPQKSAPGAEVMISGSGFRNVTEVRFGSVFASSFTIDSDTRIRAIVPNSATTGKIIIVTNTASTSSIDDFVVLSGNPGPAKPYMIYMPIARSSGVTQAENGKRRV